MKHFQEKPDLKQSRQPIRRDLLLRCAGVSVDNLRQCPENELNRYRLLGLAVLVPALLGIFSGGYAIYLAFGSLPMAVALGLLWGWVILTIDRVLIMSFSGGNDAADTLSQPGLWLRVGLALVIALTISKPIELRLFKDSITQQINQDLDERILTENQPRVNRIDSIRETIIALDAEYASRLTAWDDELARQKIRMERLQSGFIAEMDGSGGTLQRGIGPIAAQKRGQMERAEEELWYMEDKADEAKGELAAAVALGKQDKESEIRSLQKEMVDHEAEVRAGAAYDLLAQLKGLAALSDANSAVKMASWLITLLFIMIELVPLFAKSFMKRGPYHYFREDEDETYVLKAQLTHKQKRETMERRVNRQSQGEESEEILDLRQLLLEAQLSHTAAYFDIERKLEKLLRKRSEEISGLPDSQDYEQSIARFKQEFFELGARKPEAAVKSDEKEPVAKVGAVDFSKAEFTSTTSTTDENPPAAER